MATKRDYYDVLGVSKEANEQDIKKAYRKLAKQYHPDVSQESNAEEKFKEVQEAYDVLNDPQKKAAYDQFGHAGVNNNGFGGAGGGFSDFGNFGGFEDIFSSFFGGGARQSRNPNRPMKGHDLRKTMIISFEEAAFGAEKTIQINVEEECTTCGGTGAHSKKDIEVCSRCHGSGVVTVEQQTLLGRMQTQRACPTCGGSGKIIKNKCSVCHGSGRVTKLKKIKIDVPAGIDDGQQIRLSGKGEAGANGGPNGDLYILFRVKEHKIFHRNGTDIIMEMPITFSQAALGAQIEVPTLHGKVKLKVPAGTQSETKFRLRDKGVPSIRSGKKGDQHVIVKVVTPTNLSKEQTDLFNKLANTDETNNNSFFQKIKSFFS